MTRFDALPITTRYWKPGTDYAAEIAAAVAGKIRDGDFLVVSEKAVSTANGNIIDENQIRPSFNAKLLARFWMRLGWGYIFGSICHFGLRLQNRLRHYPLKEGARHKQTALLYAGAVQSLMFGSEGAIDGSNLPYSYVCLPLKHPNTHAEKIRLQIKQRLNTSVCVVIVDTDKTYKMCNFFFTARPKPLEGIHSGCGALTYIIAKALRFKTSSTPLATAPFQLPAVHALKIANIADKIRGAGGGATVWDMAARFKTAINTVTMEMLMQIQHKPIVIVRVKDS